MDDLISRSALVEQLTEWANRNEMMGYSTACDVVRDCIGVVESQPTVDEKEIIRKPLERILTRLKDKEQELRTARHNLSVAMYTDAKAYDKARILTQKELVINEAKQIVKEEGEIE